ncbi:14003_t:CDS:1, partial [Racocetra fulgida]
MNKELLNDESFDTIYHEYKRAKKNYQQSNLTKERFKTIRMKLFNATSASSNHDVAFNTYKEIEDDDNDALNYRIKYKIGLHYLSGVGCEQDIDNGYRKIVEAENFHLPDAKSWINKYGGKKDHGAE